MRGLRAGELPEMARAYGKAVNLAREAGFDAVEIHAGHGYLISQFLSPSTNHRKDEFGGSLENRMRFMDMVMDEVMKAAGSDMAVLVKMNMRDGFRGGMEIDETMQVAKRLECSGAHGLVLSGGFVSKAPMYVMRGEMPIRSMTHYMTCWWLKYTLNEPPLRSLRKYKVCPSGERTGLRSSPAWRVRLACLFGKEFDSRF